MNKIVAVFLGGGLGSLARLGIAELVRKYATLSFPLATFVSNLLSCIILALAIGFFAERFTEQPAFRFLIITGFCGGFSTFSAFSFETTELLRAGNTGIALLNIILSLGVCFALMFFLLKKV
jgi:CrcB protein